MRIKITNETGYDTKKIRKLVRASLKAVGYDTTINCRLLVEVVYSRSRHTTGWALIGHSRRFPALLMKLRFPKPDRWWSGTWRGIVAVAVHECMHLVGVQHRDMTKQQRWCSGPIPAWAKELEPFISMEDMADDRVLQLAAGRDP